MDIKTLFSILKVRIGSYCHGVNLPTSDEDIRDIVIPPIDYFFGLYRFDQSVLKVDGNDYEYWNIMKLFNLLMIGNPSALNILHTDPKDIIYVNDLGHLILYNKNIFLSRRFITSVIGYVNSQINKIICGRGTKEGRRQSLVEQFGFDVHFAYHAVLLTFMALELLNTGTYCTLRNIKEIDYILKLRKGLISYKDFSDTVNSNLELIKSLEKTSDLPAVPDLKKINELLIEILENYFYGKN